MNKELEAIWSSGDANFRREVAVESLVLEATERISEWMEKEGVTKAELARRMRKSRAWATQLLNGNANMTLRTLAETLDALGAEAKLALQPRDAQPDAGHGLRTLFNGQEYSAEMGTSADQVNWWQELAA